MENNKWNILGLTGSKKSWLDTYTNKPIEWDHNPIDTLGNNIGLTPSFESLLPICMRVAFKTISQNLVSVQPMSMGVSEKILSDIKIENRDRMIDSIVDGVEYQEMSLKDHPDHPEHPGKLMYLDYKYK